MTEVLVTATVLLLAVLLIRGVLGKRLSAGARYALWGLVLLRLLIPVTFFHSPASVMNAVPKVEPGREVSTGIAAAPAAAGGLGEVGAVHSGMEPSGGAANVPGSGAAPAQRGDIPAGGERVAPVRAESLGRAEAAPSNGGVASAKRGGPEPALLGVWLAGAGLVGVWFLTVNVTFRRRLCRARRRQEGVDCPIPVYRADLLPSPCLVGVLRPAVYLNGAALADPDTLEHVLTHELCHRRHGDNLWALLRGVCLTLWWFHPLVWAAAVLSKRDCELFCDEAAVKVLGEAARIPYGRTLIHMVAARRPGPGDLLCASTAMTEGKKQIKERVVRVANRKKMPKAALAACTVLALLAGLCTFTGAVEQSVPTPMPYQVQVQDGMAVAGLDAGTVVIPDFDWVGTQAGFCREMAIQWAAEYGRQFYALPEGNPWKAADVRVIEPVFHDTLFTLGMRKSDGSETYQSVVYINGEEHIYKPSEINNASGYINLAIKPVGGIDAVRGLFQGGVPRGTGALGDYAMLEYNFNVERVAAPGGGYQWKTTGATPGWNKNPPPDSGDWTDEDIKIWSEGLRKDLGAVVTGDDRAAWEEAGRSWAKTYTGQHYDLYDQGNPAKADDVLVLAMELKTWEPNDDPQALFFHLKYAFRPVWGVKKAAQFMNELDKNHVGASWGQGELEDYVVMDGAVTLTRVADHKGGGNLWMCYEYLGQYAQNYENGMNLSLPFQVPEQVGSAARTAIQPVGVAVSYPAGSDETAMRDIVYGRWAAAFGQQFYQLGADDPLRCDKVVVDRVPSFLPSRTLASGGTKVIDGITDVVSLRLHPVHGQAGAVAALGADRVDQVFSDEVNGGAYAGELAVRYAVTLARPTAADGTVTWTCTAAELGGTGAVSDLAPAGTAMTLPVRVEPRAGWSIQGLDATAVYVPDDGRGDLRNRWAVEYGREFYALPESDPWKAEDVQVRYAGDNICLAVKPLGGTAALESAFPMGCPKGSGDLEGYILLQYGASFRRETVREFGAEPVWTAASTGILWASEPPEVGSEDWNRAMEQEWNREAVLAGEYAGAEVEDTGAESWDRAGTLWAWDYLSRFLRFGDGQPFGGMPILSDDVKLLRMELLDSKTEQGSTILHFGFEYAFRPLWGMEKALAFFDGDLEMGTGELAGYAVKRYEQVTLQYRAPENGWPGMWVCRGMA